jgi:phosphatidylglycerophosphate synthase
MKPKKKATVNKSRIVIPNKISIIIFCLLSLFFIYLSLTNNSLFLTELLLSFGLIGFAVLNNKTAK